MRTGCTDVRVFGCSTSPHVCATHCHLYPMTDLTPLFRQCVSIVSQEFKSEARPAKPVQTSHIVSDSFTKEATEVYSNLTRLTRFVSEIKPLYLQVNDEFTYLGNASRSSFSIDDKNSLDEEFKLKIQKLYEKLKYLQSYEKKRTEAVHAATKKRGLVQSLFSSDEADPLALYHTTLASHRVQIVRFLNEATQNVSSSFERMQQKRYDRERQLNLLHFQNINDNEDAAMVVDGGFDPTFQLDVVEDEHQPSATLTPQMLQELLLENAELLKMKTNQFRQVEQLHNSMVDIVKLQTELTMHLETQAEQIENILDNQDQIGVDLKLGNRTLAKATERNKRGSNLIITTCIVLGCLLLFVDYIS